MSWCLADADSLLLVFTKTADGHEEEACLTGHRELSPPSAPQKVADGKYSSGLHYDDRHFPLNYLFGRLASYLLA